MEGVKVYIPDPEFVWLPGVVTHAQEGQSKLSVRLEASQGPKDPQVLEKLPFEQELGQLAGKDKVVDLKDPQVQQTLASRHTSVSNKTTGKKANQLEASSQGQSTMLPLQNVANSTECAKTGFEDMIAIDHLHEAAILYNLRHRFFEQLPYTYTGKICIAVNPYQWLNLYDAKTMDQFRNGKREQKPPHVYAVSMEAFFNMRDKKENQSILVSGESGAGKTETTKIVMSHLAALASNSNSKVIQQIIQANPLLESFGNAKTVRNDNSSRFGKFTELQFNSKCELIGAKSRTYLLEKSRVTTQSEGERNFHVFYQLLLQKDKYPHLKLGDYKSFKYMCGSEADALQMEQREGSLSQTMQALELIGIEANLQQEILCILAAVLHLGETSFSVANGDIDASEVATKAPFEHACELLGVSVQDMEKTLCSRQVFVGREVFLKPMTRDQAGDCRDALARSLYSKLFKWLVDQINDTIGVKRSSDMLQFIGILDIFGFEVFETNSFEQFCINYANEKLQQKFVLDVLKTVQQEYEEENITWSHIRFADNQEVLDLIEGRMGVLSFLNEESLLATGTDSAFASKLGAVMENNPLFETPRLNQCAFSIHHYAGKVTYDATGFLDKHRDALLPDIKQIMCRSKISILKNEFVRDLESSGLISSSGRTASKKRGSEKNLAHPRRTTVGTQFKESLKSLMETIGLTEVHYVRCLKPNALKSAYCFSHQEIVNQLRCAGVIEAIRVSRSAYPSRLPHEECVKSFGMLSQAFLGENQALLQTAKAIGNQVQSGSDDLDDESWNRWRTLCEKLMEQLLPEGHIKDYQVGLTRVYFREGILESMQSQRGVALRKYAIKCQQIVRGFLQRRRFRKMKRNAVVIQTVWRRYAALKKFRMLRKAVISLQARLRGSKARKLVERMRFENAVVRVQAMVRCYCTRKKYVRRRQAVRKLQGFWRFTLVRLMFLKKIESEKKYKALGSKVARLQMKLDQKQKRDPSSGAGVATNAGAAGSLTSSSSSNSLSTIVTTTNGTPSASRNTRSPTPQMSSLSFGPRLSGASGILDESQEVITALHEENERLRQELAKQEEELVKLKQENRKLRDWQKSKEVDEKVQKMAHRDQESKDLTYLTTLECEYEKLRGFICEKMELPADTGSIVPTTNGSSSPPPPSLTRGGGGSLRGTLLSGDESNMVRTASNEAQYLLNKSATRLAHAKSKTSSKGNARRVKDHWEEIKNFPPPMQYTLGSVPWKRLLTDWAQGNPKKLDYMTRWLKNVLDGGPIVSDSFPMGVELKSVTPMMLDGFMQLIIPKLAERPDIQVHVHTKEFIGTSMRITLAMRDNNVGGSSRNRTGSSSGPSDPKSSPSEAEHIERVSMLMNSRRTSTGRLSNATTVSTSESLTSLDPIVAGGPVPSPGTMHTSSRFSSIFRGSRGSHNERPSR